MAVAICIEMIFFGGLCNKKFSFLKVEFHIHHAKEAARIAKIVSLLDQKTGKASKSAPRFLKAKQSAVVEVLPYHLLLLNCLSRHISKY
jgi:translation elongation factor EF-1alpha